MFFYYVIFFSFLFFLFFSFNLTILFISFSSYSVELLQGVSGYAAPGTVTALMGSSGAGKTTLLDVLADRKSSGTLTGRIIVNGRERERHSFRRAVGYVEQFDVLPSDRTVEEVLIFSARLRLPRTTPDAMKLKFVELLIRALELNSIRHRKIGEEGAGGLRLEQRKRVSIGIQLVNVYHSVLHSLLAVICS